MTKQELKQKRKELTREIIDIDDQIRELSGETKFILIIPKDISDYLEYKFYQFKTHKSETVRTAVRDMMKKDKAYEEFKNA